MEIEAYLKFVKPGLAFGFLMLYIRMCFLGKVKSRSYTEEINRYGFKLAALASLGFYLADLIPHSFLSGYDRGIKANIGNLYGPQSVAAYFQVHMAQRLTLAASALFVSVSMFLLSGAGFQLLCFGLVSAAAIHYLADKELINKIEARRRAILTDLPIVLNALTILVNAGLTVNGALTKIVREGDAARPLNQELCQLIVELNAGKPVAQAYEDFAFRCKVPEVTRFASTILQNLNRGSSDLVYILRILAQEGWNKRKDIILKQGEEASTKLIIPMVMVFVAVTIIVLAPALITMGI